MSKGRHYIAIEGIVERIDVVGASNLMFRNLVIDGQYIHMAKMTGDVEVYIGDSVAVMCFLDIPPTKEEHPCLVGIGITVTARCSYKEDKNE